MDLARIKIEVDTRDIEAANDEIGGLADKGKKAERDVNKSTDSMGKGFKGLSSTVKTLGGVIAGLGLVALGKSFSDTVTKAELLKGSLVTMTGSTENASLAFDKLLGFANTTPFTLDQSVTAFIRLTALGLTPSERALTSYGNTASAMGKDMMQMIEAVADASTGEFERLKEFGIRAKKQGDEVTFIFNEVATTVGMSSEEIQGYLLGIGETNFAGAMENQMTRLPGLFSQLSDGVTKFFLAIGDAGGVSILAGAVAGLSGGLDYLTNNLDMVKTGVEIMAVVLLAQLAPAIVGAIGGLTTYIGTVGLATAATTAFNSALALLGGPVGAIAMVIGAMVLLTKNNKSLGESHDKLREKVNDLTESEINQAIQRMQLTQESTRVTIERLEFQARNRARLSNAQQREIDREKERYAEQQRTIDKYEHQLGILNGTIVENIENLEETSVALEDLTLETGDGKDGADKLNEAVQGVIGTLAEQTSQVHMTALELDIYNRIKAAGAEATPAEIEQIVAMTTSLHNQKTAIQENIDKEKEKTETYEKELAEQEAKYKQWHSSISGFFTDLFTNGKDAFDNLAKSFEKMLADMVAKFLASKIMGYLGKLVSGFGSVGASIGSMLTSAGASAATGSVLGGAAGGAAGGGIMAGIGGAVSAGVGAVTGAVGQFAGGLTGGAIGTNAMMPTVFSQAGATLNAAIFNPVTAALAGLFLAWKAFGTKSTPSFNAGLMLSPLGIPGEYDIAPFASGIQPAGFTRRAGREQSDAVIETFRALDASIVQMFADAGVAFKLSGSGISGYAETGLGYGRFYGAAGEEGIPGVPVDQQLTRYAKEMFQKGAHFGLSADQVNEIITSGNYADMLEKGRMVLSGSHRNGLDYVPYDGYIAELHRGERVMTADESRGRDNEVAMKLDQLIKIMGRSSSETNQQNSEIVRNTYETARQIRDAIVTGDKASVFN
jgi:hypothetical protein